MLHNPINFHASLCGNTSDHFSAWVKWCQSVHYQNGPYGPACRGALSLQQSRILLHTPLSMSAELEYHPYLANSEHHWDSCTDCFWWFRSDSHVTSDTDILSCFAMFEMLTMKILYKKFTGKDRHAGSYSDRTSLEKLTLTVLTTFFIQCGAVITQSIFSNILIIEPYSSPVSAKYVVSVVSWISDSCSAPVIAYV